MSRWPHTFRNMPIKRKLVVITWLSNCLGLVVAGSIFVLYERHSSHEHLLRELTTTAGIIGANSASSILSDVYLRHDLKDLQTMQRNDVIIAASVLVLVSGLALVVSSQLQRIISGPLDSLATLNATLESTADGILALRLSGEVASYNTQFGLMWKIPAEVMARGNSEEVVGWVIPQVKDPERFTRGMNENFTSRGSVAFEVVELHDGRIFERHVKPQRVNGETVGVVINYRDITEPRHAEAELRWKSAFLEAQTESSLNGILVVSPQGFRLHQNRRMVEIWHAPQEVLDDHHDEALLRYAVSITRDPVQFLAKVNYLYAHPLEHSTDEVELQDGRFLERYSAPVLGGDGTHYGRIWSFRDISDRKEAEAETARLHRLLVEMSRQAGMSEVATSVLHNVGNVLNSVNISCTVIADKVRKSRIGSVAKAAELLLQHQADLAHFLTHDPHGSKFPDYLGKLAARLSQEQSAILSEVQRLDQNIDHIKHIVAVQQNYTKNLGAMGESLQLEALVEDALRMSHADLQGLDIEVFRDFCKLPPLMLEKHLVLQILVNLVRNAKHALVDGQLPGKRMIVSIARHAEHVSVSVHDNGIGIAPENLTRIFAHGFTTKKNGHGFGLHSGILAAQEMGGRLTAHSDGPGKGATFTLELPLPMAIHDSPSSSALAPTPS